MSVLFCTFTNISRCILTSYLWTTLWLL